MGIGVYVGRTVVGLEPFELERKAFQRVTTKIFERNWL